MIATEKKSGRMLMTTKRSLDLTLVNLVTRTITTMMMMRRTKMRRTSCRRCLSKAWRTDRTRLRETKSTKSLLVRRSKMPTTKKIRKKRPISLPTTTGWNLIWLMTA
jgi:hypothetical protein